MLSQAELTDLSPSDFRERQVYSASVGFQLT